jgi:hypothetical protein
MPGWFHSDDVDEDDLDVTFDSETSTHHLVIGSVKGSRFTIGGGNDDDDDDD